MRNEGTSETEKPKVMNLHYKYQRLEEVSDTGDVTRHSTDTHNTVTTQTTYIMCDILDICEGAHEAAYL